MDFTFSSPPHIAFGTDIHAFGEQHEVLQSLPDNYEGPVSIMYGFPSGDRMIDIMFIAGKVVSLGISIEPGDTLEGVDLDDAPDDCADKLAEQGFLNTIFPDSVIFYEDFLKLEASDDVIDSIIWWDRTSWDHETFLEDACPKL